MSLALRITMVFAAPLQPRPSTLSVMAKSTLIHLAAAILSGLIAPLLAVPPARAEPTHGHVETGLSMPSPMLGRGIPYTLYLPPGAPGGDDGRPIPVLYLLHGFGDTETAWFEHGHIAATLDRLISAGTIPPIAAVAPGVGESWYVDDARGPHGFGPVASAFRADFIPGIERRHHLASCRGARAIGGLSMGGYGAVLYATLSPDLFSAAISLSGSLFSDRVSDIEHSRPFYVDAMPGIYGEPFDAARFQSWTVFARLGAAAPSIKDLGFWLAVGDHDFQGIIDGTLRLHKELRRRDIETHLRIYDGSHDWALWSMAIEPALVWLAPQLKPCGDAH